MATATHDTRYATTSRLREDRPIGFSWGAIFGGAIAALAIWAMLYTLGAAIGLSTINPDNPNSVRGSGIFGGIWGLIAPLIALFCGGLVTGQAAGALARKGGAVHGLVTWALTTLFGAWLLFTFLGNLASGVASMGQAVGSAAVQGAGGLGQAAETLGIQVEDALAPVNQRLQAEGRPTISPQELEAAVRDVAQTAVRTGELDRQTLVESIAQRTRLSERDANEVASRIETQLQSAQTGIGQTALTAAERTGHVFWGIFGALLLGMLASVGGAILGVTPRMRAFREPPRTYPEPELGPSVERPREIRGS